MKYVMIEMEKEGSDTVVLCPVIFPNHMVHERVANGVIEAMKKDLPQGIFKVVSAGDFVMDIHANNKTGGHSTTLKLEGDPLDAFNIKMMDYRMFRLKTDK